MTYETLEGTEKLEAEVKKLKMMLAQEIEERGYIVEEKLALKEENETLKADKALLMKTVSAGVLTVKALKREVSKHRDTIKKSQNWKDLADKWRNQYLLAMGYR